MVSLNPLVLEFRQLKLLEQELFEPDKEVKRAVIIEPLHEILEFIHKENLARRPVAFRDISDRFNISKTTTGKRINELERKKLVEVVKKGRYKLLRITPNGRETLGV